MELPKCVNHQNTLTALSLMKIFNMYGIYKTIGPAVMYSMFFWLLLDINQLELPVELDIVNREEWGARPSLTVEKLKEKPKYVFIHHSYIPGACFFLSDCINAMQWMQNFHMNEKGWDDIGYSFAIGSDGRVYVGRGWDRVGAHTKGYNRVGLGFAVIGDYRFETPTPRALESLSKLIDYGLQNNKIEQDYILRAHRDMVPTESPGDALYAIIQTWPHY